MTTPDSTVPVLGYAVVSPQELMSSISPPRRRRTVDFPKPGAPSNTTFINHMAMVSCVARI